jgi:integral membrane protein
MDYLTTRLGRLKLVALLEGISLLVLLFVAMPLKYIWGKPWLVQNIGMIHGLLFILYVLQVIQAKVELGWHTGKTLLALTLSVVPLGTFYVTERMLPKLNGER